MAGFRYSTGRCPRHRNYADFQYALDMGSPFLDPAADFQGFLNPAAIIGPCEVCGHPTDIMKKFFRRNELPQVMAVWLSQADQR